VQRGRGERRGVRAFFLSFSGVSQTGSGQVRLGIDNKGFYEYGDELGRTGAASSTVNSIFLKFYPQGVRSNAGTKFEFEILKSATVDCQDIP
jgi:hypothetical protein